MPLVKSRGSPAWWHISRRRVKAASGKLQGCRRRRRLGNRAGAIDGVAAGRDSGSPVGPAESLGPGQSLLVDHGDAQASQVLLLHLMGDQHLQIGNDRAEVAAGNRRRASGWRGTARQQWCQCAGQQDLEGGAAILNAHGKPPFVAKIQISLSVTWRTFGLPKGAAD